MEDWREYFIGLLEGSQENEIERDKREKHTSTTKEDEPEDIKKEELRKVLRKLRNAKAPGEDGIENEAWKFMSEEIGEEFWKLINKIWKGGGLPRDWNRGVISPIYKRGEKNEIRNHRGITLMDSAYKIYASILNERLEEETADKLRETQFGFRKGRGTMDAVYTINYIVNKELAKKGGKIFAFFADMKAAFDKVNRKQMVEAMEKMEIEPNLRRRIAEIYEETRNVIKIGEERSQEFWTGRGLRQGCPLSPALFNIYI